MIRFRRTRASFQEARSEFAERGLIFVVQLSLIMWKNKRRRAKNFFVPLFFLDYRFHLHMGQNSKGLDWFMNVFKKMEDRCLEMCDVLEKEVLKYVEGQPNLVGSGEEYSQQPNLEVEEDQSPEKAHNADQNASSVGAFGKVSGEHHVLTEDRGTIESSNKQNHPIIEPNHFSAKQEVCGALKIEKRNAKTNIPTRSRKKSQTANAITEEIEKFSPSTIQNEEFPDWEII